MQLALSFTPAEPRVGETVVIDLHIKDTDGSPDQVFLYYGDGAHHETFVTFGPEPRLFYDGYWPYGHRYQTPGTFQIFARVWTHCCLVYPGEEGTVSTFITIAPV